MTDPLRDLLLSLDTDPRRAAERYEELRTRLVRRFASRGLPAPEDLADESFDRVARRLCEGERPRDLPRYILGAGRLVALEAARRARRMEPVEADAVVVPAEPAFDETQIETLSACLAELPETTRMLLLRYEAGQRGERIAQRRALARELGIGSNALRIRIHRLREKLLARVGELAVS